MEKERGKKNGKSACSRKGTGKDKREHEKGDIKEREKRKGKGKRAKEQNER